MADPFLAEVRMIGFNYAPRGWAFCNGQILPIAQYTALFSLVGTTYGGNGTTNFGLPDLRSRISIGFGQGPGLSPYEIGEMGGEEQHVLLTNEITTHNHGSAVAAVATTGTSTAVVGNVPSVPSGVNPRFGTMYSTGPANSSVDALGSTGTPGPHENRMPSLVLNYIIAMAGVYPPRS